MKKDDNGTRGGSDCTAPAVAFFFFFGFFFSRKVQSRFRSSVSPSLDLARPSTDRRPPQTKHEPGGGAETGTNSFSCLQRSTTHQISAFICVSDPEPGLVRLPVPAAAPSSTSSSSSSSASASPFGASAAPAAVGCASGATAVAFSAELINSVRSGLILGPSCRERMGRVGALSPQAARLGPEILEGCAVAEPGARRFRPRPRGPADGPHSPVASLTLSGCLNTARARTTKKTDGFIKLYTSCQMPLS